MKKLVFVLLLLLSSLTFAAAPIVTYGYGNGSAPSVFPFSVAKDACVSGTGYPASQVQVVVNNEYGGGGCQVQISGNWYFQGTAYVKAVCSDGSAPNIGVPMDQRCAAPPAPTCTAGQVSTRTYLRGWSPTLGGVVDAPLPTSDGVCGFDVQTVEDCYAVPSKTQATGYDRYCTYTGKNTGVPVPASDTAAPTTPPTDPKTPATAQTNVPQGQGCPAGTMNVGTDPSGISICAGQGTQGSGTPSKTTSSTTSPPVTNADGSTSITTTETKQNSDGSTTTTTIVKTTKADGSVSVSGSSTTSKTPTGVAGKNDADTTDFCQKHPQLNICNNSTVSGSGKNYSCTGDAIQCATLREVGKAFDDTPTPQSTLGSQLLNGSDPMANQIKSAMDGSSVDMSAQQLDQSGFVGGSCLPDRSFVFVGQQITVSFRRVCDNIQPLRYAVVACSLIVAYLIVSKSVLQG